MNAIHNSIDIKDLEDNDSNNLEFGKDFINEYKKYKILYNKALKIYDYYLSGDGKKYYELKKTEFNYRNSQGTPAIRG